LKLLLEEALARAELHVREGEAALALSLYRTIVNAVPNHE